MNTNISKYKVVFCGDVNSGKSTFLNILTNNYFFDNIYPTNGVDYCTYIIDNNLKFNIYDIGLSKNNKYFHCIVDRVIRNNIDHFIIFFDCTDYYYDNIIFWFDYIKQYNVLSKITIIGTKLDKLNKLDKLDNILINRELIKPLTELCFNNNINFNLIIYNFLFHSNHYTQ